MLSAFDAELVTATLQEWSNLLGSVPESRAFYQGERGSDGRLLGPLIFMSDCDAVIKSAWRQVFPRSKHLLCHWHLLRAVWTKLYSSCKTIDVVREVFGTFRAIVYSPNELAYRRNFIAMHKKCEQFGLDKFWSYVVHQWLVDEEIRSAWICTIASS